MPLACDAPLVFQLGRCRSVKEFEKLNRIGEGTYGIVCKCGAGCSLRAWGRASSWVGCSPSACILAAGSMLGWGWGLPAAGTAAERRLIGAGIPLAHDKTPVCLLALSAWPVLLFQTGLGIP